MYATFFGLKHAPFSIAPDPHYLFMSERHREALAHLLYGLEGGGGFVLLTGEIGAGKTTVCRCFLEQIPAHCNVAYIFNPKLTVVELLQAVCHEFRVPVPEGAQTVKDHVDPLNDFLLAQHAAGRNNVLIIDEAQNLSADVLEQLRLLTNLETSERKLLQVVLIGQPELRDLLARPELEQLAQRVIARCHLGPLSEAETAQYVAHRLQVAGLTGPLPFDRAALQRIHQLSRGVPRRINLLCDRALLGGYASGQAQINARIVNRAAAEVFDLHRRTATRRRKRRRDPLGLTLVVLAAAVAGAGLAWAALSDRVVRPAPAAATPPPPAARAAVSAASNPARAPAASAPTRAPAPAASAPAATWHLADWTPREADAGPALAQRWQWALPPGADLCASAPAQGLLCHRSSAGSLSLITLMDRPVLLNLQRPTPAGTATGAASGWVTLLGLTASHATLQADGQPRTVPLDELARAWRGEFITLWRPPPGYAHRNDNPGPLRQWLATELARVAGTPAASPSARLADLSRQLQTFQASQGLQPDGRLGPVTLMRLSRAAGVDEPRLAPARRPE
ncbi:ExeA family protein [Roseateles sp. BYS87W]|uniref:ExeA family protein n=1 Tax=Pelomonas baiyunensis TaxID=3299026 RepID=A0ABW7H0W5_9BURK